jgi:5-formyltetrahydrofolate cyclo-ligase
MSDSLSQTKAELRDAMRRALAALSPADRGTLSTQVCRRVMALDAFTTADTVMLFLPLPGEVDICPVALRCFQTGRTVCVPRVDWERKRMRAVEIRDIDANNLRETRHGVREPAEGRPIPLEQIGLVLVPGLAFDAQGGRLGRGGGFYDRFLKPGPANDRLRSRSWFTCGVCFDFQVVDHVPTDDKDIRLDAVATDRRLLEPCPPRRLRAT